MLKLNILPENFKKEIKLFSIYNVGKNILLLFVFFTALTGIVFLLGDAVLQTYINNSGSRGTVLQNNYQGLNRQVKEAESKISRVTAIQKDAINWSKLLEDIMVKVDDNISFSKISINREKYQLDLFGHSKTRNSLVNLKDEFEESANYLSVDFPIENILEKNDINFKMTITVDPYDFR